MRFVVALALLFIVTPGMTELGEGIAHAVGHGDLPHHDGGAESKSEGMGCDEHACTPLFHACGCHAMSAQASATATSQAHPKPDACMTVLPMLSNEPGRVGEPPPLRPPIA